MPSVNPVVYSNVNVSSWELELPFYEQQILENERLIEEQNSLLKPYNEHLNSIDLLISSANTQLYTANFGATQDLHHYDDEVIKGVIESLLSELNRLQLQRAMILSKMEPYETVRNNIQVTLSQLYARQTWLTKHIPAARLFLQTINDSPAESVNALINKLVKAFTDYEDKHLIGLSSQVRISLIAVRYGLNIMLTYPTEYVPEYLNIIHRQNYLRLSGFLWNLYHRVKQEQKDASFETILGELVESSHILEEGDLPDHLQTNFSASAWFQSNKNTTPEYFAISEQNLSAIEEQMLNNGLAFFTQDSLKINTSLQHHVFDAAKLIDAEIKMKKQKKENIDYHFYGRTVRILAEVFNNPNNQQAINSLAHIADFASGSTSVGNPVLGGLLSVLGVLLIGASMAGFLATFGSSSILSVWGATLGLSLLEAEIVCGVTSSLFAVSGLGLTFFAGPTIESGQRQGLSRKLMDVKEEAENYAVASF
ncbi:MAG: hypothetical protein HYX60_07810 [Legionella longbeachae]|nr:hypothetical protein [Legionella longbeachae]